MLDFQTSSSLPLHKGRGEERITHQGELPAGACAGASRNCRRRPMVSTVSPCGVTWASMPSMLSISWRDRLEDRGASTTAPGASDLSAMRRMRMPTPRARRISAPAREARRRQQHRVADIGNYRSDNAELPRRRAARPETRSGCRCDRGALGDRDQRAGEPAALSHITSASSPCC